MVGGIGGCTRLACEPITLNWSRRLKVLKHLGENLTWLPDSSRLGRALHCQGPSVPMGGLRQVDVASCPA